MSAASSTSRLVYAGKDVARKSPQTIFVIYVFFIGILSTQSTIGQVIGYLLGALGYFLLVLHLIINKGTQASGHGNIVLAILGLSTIFMIPIAQSPNLSTLVRVIVFIPVIILNLLFIPTSITQESFYGVLTRMAALSTLLGLPALIVGSFGPIRAYWVVSNPPAFPIALPALVSVFTNPNTMGALAFFGTLAALWEYANSNKILSAILLFINVIGVYFSQGRAAMLALFCSLTVIGIYYYTNRRVLTIATFTGLSTTLLITLIKFGFINGPGPIRDIDLNGRVHLWTAAFQAMLDQPLFGWGVGNVPEVMRAYITRSYLLGKGPHSSYMRMFAASGIAGGLLYIYIYLKAISECLVTITSNADAIEYGMVVGVAVLHTFSGSTLFGLSLRSVLSAIILGYALKPKEQ